MLVGSLHHRVVGGGSPMDDPPVRDMVEALRELREEHGPRIAFVASVDFAHVGPNYGWSDAPDEAVLAQVMEQDRRLLRHAVDGDAEGWIRFLQAERDVRSVCGAAPTYVFLRAIEGWGLSGRPLRHDLWEIDPTSGSHVSFASVAYVRPPETS
jgi:AmmeMemoRadiSam system protein B